MSENSPENIIDGGVELSERRFREIADSLHGDDPFGRRSALRVRVEGFITISPAVAGGIWPTRRVGVYDLSRSGIAIVDSKPLPAGEQFNIVVNRDDRPPIELLCTARHNRRSGEAFITGAEFGVSWLEAVGAAIAPGK